MEVNQVYFSVNVPRAVLELHRFCSTDKTREGISRIYIGRHKQVATDGHCLAYTDFDFSEEKWVTPRKEVNEVFIPGEVAKAALRGNTPKDFYSYQLEFGSQVISLVTRAGGPEGALVSSQTIERHTQSIAYPDYNQVLPKEFKPVARVGFNLSLLDLFKQYLRRMDFEVCAAEFRFTSDLGPALATRTLKDKKTEVGFLIMPIRLND